MRWRAASEKARKKGWRLLFLKKIMQLSGNPVRALFLPGGVTDFDFDAAEGSFGEGSAISRCRDERIEDDGWPERALHTLPPVSADAIGGARNDAGSAVTSDEPSLERLTHQLSLCCVHHNDGDWSWCAGASASRLREYAFRCKSPSAR